MNGKTRGIMKELGQRHFNCIEELVKPGDGLILDAFGVFWAGGAEGFYPGSLEVFQRLKAKNIPVVILSNATQLSAKAKQKYAAAGLDESFYLELVTSGEIAKELFESPAKLQSLGLLAPSKTYFVYQRFHPIYGALHLELFKNSSFKEVESLEEADFIYVGIPHINGQDQTNSQVFEQEIKALAQSRKPMVVANPDRFVKEGSQEAVVRQGEIGRLYENEGGSVFYIGKPSSLAFEKAISILEAKGISRDRLWMVGDNPETDIAGACRAEIKSILLTSTGVCGQNYEKERSKQSDLTIEAFIEAMPSNYQPTCSASSFAFKEEKE